jgi:hypothetical protein
VTDEFPDGGESMMVQGRDGTWRLTGAALDEHDDGTFTLRVAGGPWTRHGQPVPGISPPGVGPEAIDCGGVAHCSTCRRDATRIRDAHRNQGPVPPETVRYDEARGVAEILVGGLPTAEVAVRAQLADPPIRSVVITELRRLGYTITGPA